MALYDALQKRLNKTKAPLLAEASMANAGSTLAGFQAAQTGKAGQAAPVNPSLAEQAAAQGAVQDVQNAGAQNDLQARALRLSEQGQAVETAMQERGLSQQLQEGEANLAANAANTRANVASQTQQGMSKLMAQSAMEQTTISSRAEQAIRNLTSDRKISENDIFSQFHQEERELEFRRDAAAIEQLGTMMALRDRAYVDELTRVGEMKRLENNLEFSKETARIMLGEETVLYLSKLQWGEQDLMDTLKFEEKLANLSVEQAWAILKQQTAQNNATQIASGATAVVGVGLDYASQPATPGDEA